MVPVKVTWEAVLGKCVDRLGDPSLVRELHEYSCTALEKDEWTTLK